MRGVLPRYAGFDYDAIIIGTGIGGLITGSCLARQGAKVLIWVKSKGEDRKRWAQNTTS